MRPSSIGLLILISLIHCETKKVTWNEKYVRQILPPYTMKYVADHLVEVTKINTHEKLLNSAQQAANIYRRPETRAENTLVGDEKALSCYSQTSKLALDFLARETYAVYVEDSNGRAESGLYKGNYLWLGNYYECTGQTNGQDIVTKMCVVVIGDQQNSTDGLYIGSCVPEICTEEQVNILIDQTLQPGEYATSYCHEDKPFSNGDIAMICILSILAFFVFVGTTCETVCICLDLYYGEANPAHEARKKSIPVYLMLCFSLIKNTKAIFNTKRKESQITVLDGIRFLSMAWVILGHTVYFSISTLDNLLDVANYYVTHGSAQAVVNGTFSVDSFFFLSGTLVTYLTLREMRRSGSLNVPIMYLHRYLRLTPTLALVMLFTTTLFQRSSDVPIFEMRNYGMAENCKKYWMWNILYWNNLLPKNSAEGCIGWVWYLAVDMQFFVIAPIFIFLLYRYPKIGLGVMAGILFASVVITGVISSNNAIYPDVFGYALYAKYLLFIYTPRPLSASYEHQSLVEGAYDLLNTTAAETTLPFEEATTTASSVEDDYNFWADTYFKPWCRIGAYLVGMVTGYILFITNKKIKIALIYVIQLWVASAALAIALIYGWWGDIKRIDWLDYPSEDLAAFYEAVKRPLWTLPLMWITIACSVGYGGPVNSILSWKVFMPLGRLTFGAYLVHPLVLFYMHGAREHEPHFRINTYIYAYLAALVLSYMASYVIAMLIELPMAGLQNIIFYTPKGKKPWYSMFAIKIAQPKSEEDQEIEKNTMQMTEGENEMYEKAVDIADEVPESEKTKISSF